jgi:predicted amidophosphoribosyltransferase
MWPAIRDRFISPLVDLVFPPACLVCHETFDPITDPHSVCQPCRTVLLSDPFETCPRCAGTVGPFAAAEDGCTECQGDHFVFDRAIRLGPYVGALRDVVLRMKEAAGESLAETIGHLWARSREAEFRSLDCSAVVPIPLHWKKRLVRGYNPAAALARAVASELGLPYRRCLRRIRNTPRQTDQTPESRRTNVKGAFASRRGNTARDVRFLLIDDVLTTGSTCSAAAAVLRAAGAKQVIAAVLAHR